MILVRCGRTMVDRVADGLAPAAEEAVKYNRCSQVGVESVLMKSLGVSCELAVRCLADVKWDTE